MTTITETITGKLLDGAMDPTGLQSVLQEYSHNKGPLYSALAQATSIMIQKLVTTAHQYEELETQLQERQQLLKQTEQKLDALDQQIAAQSNKLASLELKVQENAKLLEQAKSLAGLGFGPLELEKLHHVLMSNVPSAGKPEDAIDLFFKFMDSYPHLADVDSTLQEEAQKLASLEGKIQAKQALVDEVKTLGGLGMGVKELVKLHDLLVKFGASQGMPPSKIMKLLFNYVSQFQEATALDTHIQQLQTATATAKAETEHWQAEAKAAETKAKARKSSIEITEKLLAHGIKEPDLPHWAHILEKSGIPVEELSQALGQFASLDNLCQHRRDKADKLEAGIQTLTAQVNALKVEREQVSAAITAVRDRALDAHPKQLQLLLKQLLPLLLVLRIVDLKLVLLPLLLIIAHLPDLPHLLQLLQQPMARLHAIPNQGVVCRIMNVRLYRRTIGPQTPPILHPLFPHHDPIDLYHQAL